MKTQCWLGYHPVLSSYGILVGRRTQVSARFTSAIHRTKTHGGGGKRKISIAGRTTARDTGATFESVAAAACDVDDDTRRR